MSIADKLIYLNGTKEKLKESINNIGGSITNETTFRAYAEELDNIYSNIPKTTGEGSNLSLTTIKGRINVDDIKGDTEQDGTPTPDSPQDIEVVTGQQEVLVRGKNLFDGILELGIINGNTGLDNPNNSYIRAKDYIAVEELSNYKFSCDNSNVSAVLVYEYKADKSYNMVTNKSVGLTSYLTTEKDTAYIRFRPNYATTDTTIKFMVEKGTTASAWQPYQEQTKIVNLSSKNLFDKTRITANSYVNASTGAITSYTGTFATDFIKIKPSTTYRWNDTTRTNLGAFYNSNYQYISGFSTLTFTTPSNATFVRLTGTTTNLDTAQLEKGSSSTTYENYWAYELSKIGTYQDRIFETSGKNLLNNELPQSIYYHNCSTTYSNGQIVINSTGSDAFFGNVATTNGTAYGETFGQLIEVEEGQDYTFSTTNSLISKNFITYFNEQKVSIGYLFINSANRTITMPSDTKYVAFRIGYGDSTSGATYKVNVMLNKGSSSLPYEPYGSDKWYIEKNIGKITGSGLNAGNNIGITTQGFYLKNIGAISSSKQEVICNGLINKQTTDTAWNEKDGKYIGQLYNGYANIYINKDFENTSTGQTNAVTWLNTFGFKLYYVLETTTYTEITNTNLLNELNELEKIMSYNGTTNINISGNLPMLVSVSALKGE